MNPSYYPVGVSASSLNFSVGYLQDLAEMDADFEASIIQDEHRCRYPSKRCELPRAIKRNGEMHRFCNAHRDKANLNQRRLEARRKLEMKEAKQARSSSSPKENEDLAQMQTSIETFSWTKPSQPSPPLHSVLAQDELNFLSELLSQNSLDDIEIENEYDDFNVTSNLLSFGARFASENT
ncbi:unnamed protein product [Phytophthora lilii]|uniref:Unnamed protein product n=1 Tax=Phytophthora lilii TaxID=2077276 RepID=A0A9W6WU53_9STRA|nr:unnamed protein product [Phytophthora lilii]